MPLIGALLTLATSYALGRRFARGLPLEIALGIGAAIHSLLVFALLSAGVAHRWTFLALAAAVLLTLRRTSHPPLKRPSWFAVAIYAGYAMFYLAHAMAPETGPDAMGYRLGLVREYARLGRFPERVAFYEVLPQGMEMLYLFAYAFGRHVAAKLVHFAFLLATPPLILRLGRRLGLPDYVSATGGLLYFCAPVVGVSGTSAYTDAAGVFFTLAAVYLLAERRPALAGIATGFCYAIKISGALVPAAAVLVSRRALTALLLVAPWMLRSYFMTGNPVAPLMNRWFDNPYFHPALEAELARQWSSYGLPSLWHAPWQLAAGGLLQGIVGPAYLALPAGLLALRHSSGRLLWAVAAVLALPWFANLGARFLMPALPFLALALALALPRPAAWALAVFQAAACLPPAIALYESTHTWRLRGLPLPGQGEQDYLWARLDEYKVARLLEDHTRPGERIFALMGVARAYTDREVLEFWHSAQAEALTEALKYLQLYEVSGHWNAQPLGGVRVRAQRVHEVRLHYGPDRIHRSPQWNVHAQPNGWEAGQAWDGNIATSWRARSSVQGWVEARFDRPQVLDRAVVVSADAGPVELEGLAADGRWRRLTVGTAVPAPMAGLPRQATRAVKARGFSYILAPRPAYEPPEVWGLEVAGTAGSVRLYRIR